MVRPDQTKQRGGNPPRSRTLPPEVFQEIASFVDEDTRSRMRRTGRTGLAISAPYGPFRPPTYGPSTLDFILNNKDLDTFDFSVLRSMVHYLLDNDSLQNRDIFAREVEELLFVEDGYIIFDMVRALLVEIHMESPYRLWRGEDIIDTIRWILSWMEDSGIDVMDSLHRLADSYEEMVEWFLNEIMPA